MSIVRAESLTSKHYRKRRLKNSDPLFLYTANNIRQTTHTEGSETSMSFFKKSRALNLSQTNLHDTSNSKIPPKGKPSNLNKLEERLKTMYPNTQLPNNNENKNQRLVKENRGLVMDNIRIEKENMFLLKTIKGLESELEEARFIDVKSQRDERKSEGSGIIVSATIELSEKISKLEGELGNNEAVIQNQMEEINKLNYVINGLREELNTRREIALMQREEYLSQAHQNQILRVMIRRCREINKRLYNEIKTSKHNKMYDQQVRQTEFSYEETIYHTVVNKGNSRVLERMKKMPKCQEEISNVYPFYYPLAERLDLINNLEAVYENKNGVKEEIVHQQEPMKPAFFSFIMEEFEGKGYSQDIKSSTSEGLIPLLRCILDSYFSLLLYHHDTLGAVPDFPEFVYDYNTQFCYDKDKLRMQPKIQNSTVANCEFYAKLMMEELNNNWEVVAFREFLLEKLNFECLFFYLQVTNHLLNNEISTHISSHFETYFHIRLEHAEQTLRLFLSSINKNLINTAYKSLKAASTLVNNHPCVELGFTARILLEFFKANRQKQLKAMASTIKQVSSTKLKPTLTLLQFSKLIQHKYKITYLKTISMYRRCFSLGDGHITPQSVIAVILELRLDCNWVAKKNQQYHYFTQMLSFIKRFNLTCIQNSTSNRYADDLGIGNPCFIQGSLPDQLKIISHFRNVFNLCLLHLKKQILKNTLQLSKFSSAFHQITDTLLNITLRQHYKQIKLKEEKMGRVAVRIQRKFRSDMGSYFDQLKKVTEWNQIKHQ